MNASLAQEATNLVHNFMFPSTSTSLVTSFHVRPSSVEYWTLRPGNATLVSSLLSMILKRNIHNYRGSVFEAEGCQKISGAFYILVNIK